MEELVFTCFDCRVLKWCRSWISTARASLRSEQCKVEIVSKAKVIGWINKNQGPSPAQRARKMLKRSLVHILYILFGLKSSTHKKAGWCLPYRPIIQSYPCNLDAFLSRSFSNKILYYYILLQYIIISYSINKRYIMFVLYRGVSNTQDASTQHKASCLCGSERSFGRPLEQ